MIEQLIAVLRGAKLDPTAEELADALWLAANAGPMRGLGGAARPPDGGGDAARSPPDVLATDDGQGPQRGEEKRARSRDRRDGGLLDVHQAGAGIGPAAEGGKSGIACFSPAAPALPGALDVGRALRPLKRRVASQTQFTLDEPATARRIAEGDPLPLVLRPLPVRWLDVTLLVDEGPSMAIWRQTARELASLLERHGAFRQVRRLGLVREEDGELHIIARGAGGARRPVAMRELIDPSGRRLILVVSDGVSPAWDDGSMGAWIRAWGRHGPVALVQVLPERLWHRTGLGAAVPVRLRARASASGARGAYGASGPRGASGAHGASGARGAPTNARLIAEELGAFHDLGGFAEPGVSSAERVFLPVIELERGSIQAWAKMIAGNGPRGSHGVEILAGSSARAPAGDAPGTMSGAGAALSARERVYRFRATASPKARELATVFAAAGYLSLPVMRQLWRAVLPEATLGHLAEVFLGGLLQEIGADSSALDPEYVRYDFVDGVRELLLDGSSADRAAQVLAEVSDYVTRNLGYRLSFRALLADPSWSGAGEAIPARERPFAKVGAMVLSRLGGAYHTLAHRLSQAISPRGLDLAGAFEPSEHAGVEERSRAPSERPRPPRGASDPILAQLAAYAEKYTSVRRAMPPGSERTAVLDGLVNEMRAFARFAHVPVEAVLELPHDRDEGSRLVALAILDELPGPIGLEVVVGAIAASRSAFEQFYGLAVALRMLPALTLAEKQRILREVIRQRSGEPGTWICDDGTGRWELSGQILAALYAPVQVLLVLDVAPGALESLADVDARVPARRSHRLVLRWSEAGVKPTSASVDETFRDWASATSRMAKAARDVCASSEGLPVHVYVAGLAPLPLFAQLGMDLSQIAPVTLFVRESSGKAWEALPLHQTPDSTSEPYFRVIRGLDASVPSQAEGRVAVFVSSGPEPPRDAMVAFVEEHGERVAGTVEVLAHEHGYRWLDARHGASAMEQLKRIFSQIPEVYPRNTGLALFIAGPGALAFMVGATIDPRVYPDVWVPYSQAPYSEDGVYRFALQLKQQEASAQPQRDAGDAHLPLTVDEGVVPELTRPADLAPPPQEASDEPDLREGATIRVDLDPNEVEALIRALTTADVAEGAAILRELLGLGDRDRTSLALIAWRSIAWLDRHGRAEAALPVLGLLLDQRDRLEPHVVQRVVECALGWLDSQGPAPEADVLLASLLDLSALDPSRALLDEAARWALAWIRAHGGDRDGRRLLDSYFEARADAEEALAAYEALVASRPKSAAASAGLSRCALKLGELALERGDHEKAWAHYDRARACYRQLGDRRGEAACLQGFGAVAARQENLGRAEVFYEAAMEAHRETGDRLGEATCARRLGAIALAGSDLPKAQAHYEAAFALYVWIGDVRGEAHCLLGLGDTALAGAHRRAAKAQFEAALSLYRQVSDAYSVGMVHRRLARLAVAADERGAHINAARVAWLSIGRSDLSSALDNEFGRASR